MSSVLDRRDPTHGRAVTLPATRPRRLGDPFVVGVVALVVYGLHGFDAALDRDLGVFTYGGIQVAHGTPPYVDNFNSVGPLADAVPGLAIWLGGFIGVGPVLSERMFFAVLSALCCSLLFVLARDTLDSRAAGFIAPAVFLTFGDFLGLASDGPREKTTMVVFLIGCLILLGRRRWALAGACAALATLAWQPVFAVTLGALAAAALLERQDTKRRVLLRFTVGGLVPSLATVGYFLVAGALSNAIKGFILINAEYTHQSGVLSHPHYMGKVLWSTYQWTLPLIVGGLVLLFAMGARAIPYARRPSGSPVARRLVVCAAGGLVGTAWTLEVSNGGPDLFVVLPFAALGVAGTAVWVLGHLPRRVALAGVVAIVSVGVVAAGLESVTSRSNRLDLERADVNAVLGTQPGNARIVSLSAPQVLALAGRESPVPYQILTANVDRFLEGTYPDGLAGYLHTLVDLRPTFVVVGRSFNARWADTWLRDDYERVGIGPGWTWYLNRSAGHDAVVRARHAHHAVMVRYGR